MPEDHLADCQRKSLARVVHRSIGGLLINVEGFEVSPHGMRDIRDAPMRQRVSQQQVTELVMDAWLRNRKYW